MPKPKINLVGQRFGYLEVIERAPEKKNLLGKAVTYWTVRCHAGGEGCVGTKIVSHANLTTKLKSCGCKKSLSEQHVPEQRASERPLLETYSPDFIAKVRADRKQGDLYTNTTYLERPVPGETWTEVKEIEKTKRLKKPYWLLALEFNLPETEAKRICKMPLTDPEEVKERKRLSQAWEDNLPRMAFEVEIPFWQEKVHEENGLVAVDYSRSTGQGYATNTRVAKVIRPFISDFVVDVEISARRVLTPTEFRYFIRFYRDESGDMDKVEPENKDVDDKVRYKVGKELARVGIHPREEYFKPVDLRGRNAPEALQGVSNIVDISTAARKRPRRSTGTPEGGIVSISAAADEGLHICAAAEVTRPRYLTTEDAADYLGGLNSRTVARWAREGYLPAIPLGEGKKRLWRFTVADLDAWMEGRKRGGALAA